MPAWLVAVVSGALAVVASYAIQRLLDAQTEPPLGTVLAQTTIPYYWRMASAVLHGSIVGVLAGAGLTASQRAQSLPGLRWLVLVVVVPAAIAMAWVP